MILEVDACSQDQVLFQISLCPQRQTKISTPFRGEAPGSRLSHLPQALPPGAPDAAEDLARPGSLGAPGLLPKFPGRLETLHCLALEPTTSTEPAP